MAGGGDCLGKPADGEIVPVTLSADMLEIIDRYCRQYGLADRGEAINELLMIGLSWSMTDPANTDC